MQKYNKNADYGKFFSISGYAWLILVINQEEVGARLGLSRNYVKHIPMFKDFLRMQWNGDKKAYIYARLGERYGMHPSSVKRVVSMLLHTVEL